MEEFFHAIELLLLYVWDRKAHNRKLGLRDTYCQNCHTSLGKEFYRDLAASKTKRQATLQDYIEADKLYRKHLELFRQKIPRGQPDTIHEVDRDAFKESLDYLSYVKQAGPQYNGFCIDQVTPLECHVTGTLQAEILVAEFLVELALVLAQQVEQLHPNLGVHAFMQACRFAGIPHEAEPFDIIMGKSKPS